MKEKILNLEYVLCALVICFICSCEHIPELPSIIFDANSSELIVSQTDTAAHDTVFISVDDLYSTSEKIENTIEFPFHEILKEVNQLKLAYRLAERNCSLSIDVKTSRTNDTIFHYIYKEFEIPAIPEAKIISGNCVPLCDLNSRRNFMEQIRLWIFKNEISPDSILVEKMNSLMKQFCYSNRKEYSKKTGEIPVVSTLLGAQYQIKTDIKAKYYYLFACQSGNKLKKFIEEKISYGLKDAYNNPDELMNCFYSGESGTNAILLIGINENWKYTILPIGLIAIDNMGPEIHVKGLRHNNAYDLLYHRYTEDSNTYLTDYAPSSFFIKSQNIFIRTPSPSKSICGSVSVSYGNFEGNGYFGYNIPFYIDVSGDVSSITIGKHTINPNAVKKGECVRLLINGLHTGDNSLSISAVDSWGNKSTSSISIPLVAIRNNYNDDDDDEDYEDRISDLEERIEELEDME